MALSKTDGSGTIGATEFSAPANANYSSGSPQTADVMLQAWFDLATLAAGDEYQFRVYEKVNGGTQRVAWQASAFGVQTQLLVLPSLILMDAWDVTVKKISGTDRVINWSLRQVS